MAIRLRGALCILGKLALTIATSSCAAEPGDGADDDAEETADAVRAGSLPNEPTCRGKEQCTISPSGRANFYRVGSRYQVDLTGITTGRSDNGVVTAAVQSIGEPSETARWVIDEAKRRKVAPSSISLRGHSLGGIDAMSIVARGGVSRAIVFGVPSQAILRFSNELRLSSPQANVTVTIVQGERDPVVVGTSVIDDGLDSRIRLKWVPSPLPSGTNMANHARESYCRFAPETCFS